MKKPNLAEVHCSKIQFNPGDRILVRVLRALDSDELDRLVRTIKRWAEVDVEVLVVDCTKVELKIENNQRRLSLYTP